MGVRPEPDFSGWATRANLKCSDGRTIMPDAFKHQDQATVPLVWQHGHNDPANVLGHVILEHRDEGVYSYAYFNDTPAAQHAKTLVEHKDITSLSIYANSLTEKAKQVYHGIIREVSLVLSGANPGALIDNIALRHADGEIVTLDDEAIIYTGLELKHGEEDESTSDDDVDISDTDSTVAHAEEKTVQEVYDAMSDEEKDVVHYLVGAALEQQTAEAVSQSAIGDGANSDPGDETDADDTSADAALTHNGTDKEEGTGMKRNVFEQRTGDEEKHVLTHDAVRGIVEDAKKRNSLKEAIEHYALQHGITDIDVLFPDARAVTETPEFDKRRTEWVAQVLGGTRHTPFSRIKSIVADLTFEEARAKGYVKGNLKKEEFFGLQKRVTTPSTVYKKQKLDRDDIIDITDFDVVVWLWAEMRLMLEEELARAILIGDGRPVDAEDKIKDPAAASEGAGVRSILNDADLYAATVTVDDTATNIEVVDAMTASMGFYKGSGAPVWYTTLPFLTRLLTTRDEFGHRLWKTKMELAGEVGVSDIVTVDVMEDEEDVLGIIVNLRDYTIGTDAGGEITKFDDFDIDYNQYKYLLETRLSGALTKIRSAIVVKRSAAGASVVVPTEPSFDGTTVTIPTVTGVTYKNADGNVTVTGTIALDPGESVHIYTVAGVGYFFPNNIEDEWTFTNTNSA